MAVTSNSDIKVPDINDQVIKALKQQIPEANNLSPQEVNEMLKQAWAVESAKKSHTQLRPASQVQPMEEEKIEKKASSEINNNHSNNGKITQSKAFDSKRRATLSIKEIKEKLISKMPNLKSQIQSMEQAELRKMLFECYQNKDKSKSKPVIRNTRSSEGNRNFESHNSKTLKNQISKHVTDKSSTQMYQLLGNNGKSKSRTIILMHVQDTEQGEGVRSKVRQVQNCANNACNCNCCKRNRENTIDDIFKKILRQFVE